MLQITKFCCYENKFVILICKIEKSKCKMNASRSKDICKLDDVTCNKSYAI